MKNRILTLILCGILMITSTGCEADSESSSLEISEISTTTPYETSAASTSSATSSSHTTQLTEPEVQQNAESSKTAIASSEVTAETVITYVETAEAEVPAEEQLVAECYVGLYRLDTMECLYQEGEDVSIYPASLTKILTACTALKYASPDTIYTVGTELALVQPHSSLCMIQQGHQLTLRDLLTGMLMSSGNDAAYTIAVNIAREVTENLDLSDEEATSCFVGLMNDYAAELGAESTHFINPEGWDNPQHRTTVHDLALISAHAMQYDVIREIASTPSKYVVFASGEIVTWYNTNALLHEDSEYYLPQAIGLKTGTTDLAGMCLVAVIEADGVEYIAISANCQTNEERYCKVLQLVELLT